jgi:hypothetical protein
MSTNVHYTQISDPQLLDIVDEAWLRDKLPDDSKQQLLCLSALAISVHAGAQQMVHSCIIRACNCFAAQPACCLHGLSGSNCAPDCGLYCLLSLALLIYSRSCSILCTDRLSSATAVQMPVLQTSRCPQGCRGYQMTWKTCSRSSGLLHSRKSAGLT